MPAFFDPVAIRKSFDEFMLDMELNENKAHYASSSVGNAAIQRLSTIIEAWFVGLHRETHSGLEGCRDWLEDSLAQNEVFGDNPDYFAMLRKRAYGLSCWMLGNENHEAIYLDAIAHQERAWETNWSDGKPATNKDRLRGSFGDYLADCIQSGQYKRGLSTSESLDAKKTLQSDRPVTAEKFGYWLCRRRVAQDLSENELLDVGSRFLTANLESKWLGHGQAQRAAVWLKIVFWHEGRTKSALDTLLTAYDLMPHVQRPSFVQDDRT